MYRVCAAAAALLLAPLMAAAQPKLPDYYPKDYGQIVEAAKKEGKLVVYSIMADYNWKPVLEGFKKQYPGIEVQTLDLGSGEVMERYYSEKAAKARTADLLINGAVDKWLAFAAKDEILQYESPEMQKLPAWSQPRKSLYTVSADPMVLVWNKALVSEAQAPKSLADVAKLAADPKFKNKITTYNAATEAFGLSVNWAYVKKYGDGAWAMLDTIGKVSRPERSAGPMVEKITSGEHAIGYFVSGIVVFPKLDDAARAKILGWSFPKDGTPIVLRGMAIPKGATSVNAAKLMVDYILSHDGQVGFGKGGLTPYRPDVKKDEVPRHTYQTIVEALGGEQNVVLVEYDDAMTTKGPEFQARWKKAFNLP